MTATVAPSPPTATGPAATTPPDGGPVPIRRWGPWLLALEAASLNAAAALPWLRAFAIADARSVLLAAATLPVLVVAVLGTGLHRRPAVSFVASAALLVALIAAGVAAGPAGWAAGLRHGPAALLTETLPLTGPRHDLLAPVLLTWAAGAASAELLLRGRHNPAGLAPPVVAYLLAFAGTSGAVARDDATGPLLLACLVVAALTRWAVGDGSVRRRDDAAAGDEPADAAPRRRRPTGSAATRLVAAGAALSAATVAVLGAVAPALPDLRGRPASLTRRPPVATTPVIDPVDAIAALRDANPHAPAVTLLRLTTASPTPGYLALAYLDLYDGATWGLSTTFTPTGERIPLPPPGTVGAPGGAASSEVTSEVTAVRADGLPLVPVLGRPTSVTGLPVDANPSTGMVVPAEPSSGPTPSFRVRAVAPTVTLATVDPADGLQLTGRDAGRDLGVPTGTSADLAVGLRYLASITRRRPSPTLGFLQAAAAALRSSARTVDPAASAGSTAPTASRGGTSLAEVITSVALHGRATPEQFATFFVLMARDLGVPARIATGFRVGPAGGGTLGAGTYPVTDREAWTWAQIPVAGIGWVDADPTPTRTANATAVPPAAAAQATTTTLAPHQASALPANAGGGTHALAAPDPLPATGGGGGSAWLWWLLAAVALAVALTAAVPGLAGLRRARRRHLRRRAGDPATVAAGAWLELLDALEVGGVGLPGSATPADVGRALAEQLDDNVRAAVVAVGSAAERAVCAPLHPPSASDADEAWAAAARLRRHLTAGLARRDRLRALLRVGHQPVHPAEPARPPAVR